MNKVIMMGRVVNDPEIRVASTGNAVAKFRIAVDRNRSKSGEERKSDFFNVTAFGKTAELISKWFPKGKPILVEGELQTSQYTDKNGNPSTWYEIIVNNVYFTLTDNTRNGGGNYPAPPASEPPAGYGGGYNPAPAAPAAPSAPAAPAADFSAADSDDYPF